MNYDQAKAQVFACVTPQVGEVRFIPGGGQGQGHTVHVDSFDEEWITLSTISAHPLVKYQHNLLEWCDNVASGKYTKR